MYPPGETGHATDETRPMRAAGCVASLLLAWLRGCAGSAGALGLDPGSKNSVIAIARRGGVDVIANDASHRQTPSVVGFEGRRRLLGESGARTHVSNPSNFVSDLRLLLGLTAEEVSMCLPALAAAVQLVGTEEGTFQVQVEHMGEVRRYSAVQLFAMLLHHLHKLAEEEHGFPLRDCAIAVPLSYDASQRQAVLDAAEIAGLKCQRLVLDVRVE